MGKIKNGCVIVGLVIVGSVYGLGRLGAGVSDAAESPSIQKSIIDDAHAALDMQTHNPTTKELHYLSNKKVLCGLVKHDDSEVGAAPFAYSHSLGLTVAKVWGKGEPEELNRLYGCSFLPIAYVKEWQKPFWGNSSERDVYIK